jgi:hypothetical protein
MYRGCTELIAYPKIKVTGTVMNYAFWGMFRDCDKEKLKRSSVCNDNFPYAFRIPESGTISLGSNAYSAFLYCFPDNSGPSAINNTVYVKHPPV